MIWMLWHAEAQSLPELGQVSCLVKLTQETIWNRYIVGQRGDIIRQEMVKDDWELVISQNPHFQQCFAVSYFL